MKLEALDHPKTLDLASRLNVELPTAIGYLELLWAFTGKKAPQGNVGKWPDGAIARACYFMGNAGEFIDALIAAGLLDRDDEHRLAVHDWRDHAPRWVKSKLAHLKLPFVGSTHGSKPVDNFHAPAGSDTSDDADDDSDEDDQPLSQDISPPISRPSKGSEVKGSEEKTSHSDARADSSIEDSEQLARKAFDRVRAAYPKFAGRQDWINAQHACRIRIQDDGQTWETLEQSAARFAAYIRHLGKEGTPYVMSPGKFFSAPDQPWAQPWELPIITNAIVPRGTQPNAILTHDERERVELEKLKARRPAIGIAAFRDPLPGESSSDYRRAQDSAWDSAMEKRRGARG